MNDEVRIQHTAYRRNPICTNAHIHGAGTDPDEDQERWTSSVVLDVFCGNTIRLGIQNNRMDIAVENRYFPQLVLNTVKHRGFQQ